MPVSPGPLNLVTDVEGVTVGHSESADKLTGVTVLITEHPAITSVDQRGGAPGTRETDVFTPGNLVDVSDALVFSGGSAFGLESATGVQKWLHAQGRGFPVGKTRIPIVPSAVIFDLFARDSTNNLPACDYAHLGHVACESNDYKFALGNAGAGCGAVAGDLKGGTGSASLIDHKNGYVVGALAIVNSAGSTIIPGTSTFWAWSFEQQEELGQQQIPCRPTNMEPQFPKPSGPLANTTLVAVVTDAPLTSYQTKRLAIMAQDGLGRAIRPAHAPQDGALVFALSTTG